MNEITATELKARMDAGDDIQLIDVRQPDEYAFAKIDGAKLIPLGEIPSRMSEIDPSKETIVHCKMGGRSAKAAALGRRATEVGMIFTQAVMTMVLIGHASATWAVPFAKLIGCASGPA